MALLVMPSSFPDATRSLRAGDEAKPGLIAGRFETVRTLGEGAFSVVHEAIDRELGRRVALKLFTGYRRDLDIALREARAMARLNHEHVLAIHDVGQHRGTPFLAMEYAQMDLRRWLASGTREPDNILHLFIEAGQGLAAAHRAGLVHHDFKPANVMLRDDGSVAVGDFGLARHLDSREEPAALEPSVGSSSYAFGTLRYIAPERLLGLAGDERSDQFSFCVALWEALAQQHPFTGSDAQRRYDSIASGPVGTPRAAAHVLRALRRGLALEAYDRFSSMDELLCALEQPQHSAPVKLLRRSVRPAMTAAMLVGVFVLGVGLSREAPALDVSITPTPVLTADAAVDHARDLVFDGDYRQVMAVVMNTVPVIRETDVQHQHAYLAELEFIATLLSEAGAYKESALVYSAGLNLAKDLGVDPTPFIDKRATAQAKARRTRRALTRDR